MSTRTTHPAPDARHVRIVDDGAPQIISIAEALAEITRAQTRAGRRAVREMSAARSTARIAYRDERGTVVLRPATAEDIAAAADAAQGRRPAAEVLAADPVPAGRSVYEAMPGHPASRADLTGGAFVVQERDAGAWHLPNHDNPAHLTRAHVATALRGISKRTAGRARVSMDADGTVYVSDGRQAARYLPAELIAEYIPGQCPGCRTWYADNGDGPCPGATPASHA
ncbi:hypothetical protein ACFW6R_29720 [Streptomyces albidoflavus]|uniref:hypothetical protein n=1 Tax=Streptomyces albidoflavus TaxID=1886 RepID=UPI00331DD4E1